jgi:glycosyltransferase involved in cell wall biosynthesis
MLEAGRGSAVSVVIPNWNGRRWLPGCLQSLTGQTFAPAEVIVVDNGSSDGSVAYLAAEHPTVQIIALERNTGFAHAANRGVAAAAHQLVALINTDIVLMPDWIARMVATACEHPSAARCCRSQIPTGSMTPAMCCAATARASSADGSCATMAGSILRETCLEPAPGRRCTAARSC